MRTSLMLALATQCAAVVAHGQIRYLTVQAPHTPLPAMGVMQLNLAPAPQSFTRTPVPAVPAAALAGADFDKAEVDKRVIAFQKQRAREGSASAAYELALRYIKGDGVEKDTGRARQWLKLAADAGHAEARKKLAELATPQK